MNLCILFWVISISAKSPSHTYRVCVYMCVCVCACTRVLIKTDHTWSGSLHLLDDAFLGLQHEVAVVHPRVGEVDVERGEYPEGLRVFSPQLLGHVEAVHHLALPSFHGLVDAVQELHLQRTHMPHKCCFFTTRDNVTAGCQRLKQTYKKQHVSSLSHSMSVWCSFLL